jgi:hypothetical protein
MKDSRMLGMGVDYPVVFQEEIEAKEYRTKLCYLYTL